MFSESTLEPSLIQSYQTALYRVDTEPSFVLKVGETSPALAQLLQRMKADCAAYFTACNPWGQQLTDAENADRQSALKRELNRLNVQFISGMGLDSKKVWPGEASVLILDLSLEATQALGRKYEQNAVVWSAQDAIPQLILLK